MFKVEPPKHYLPALLQQNPDMCTSITQYTKEHLGQLSIEILSEYIHETIIPKLVSDILEEDATKNPKEQYEQEMKAILKMYGLTCISPSAVYQSVIHLGFKYEPRRKGYFVDSHEKPATVAY